MSLHLKKTLAEKNMLAYLVQEHARNIQAGLCMLVKAYDCHMSCWLIQGFK